MIGKEKYAEGDGGISEMICATGGISQILQGFFTKKSQCEVLACFKL